MQLTIYLLSAVALLAAAYLIFRVIVRRDYRQRGKLSALGSFLEVLIFFLHGIFTYTFLPADWPALHVHPALSGLGIALIVAGLFVTLLAMGGLGWKRAVGQQVEGLRTGAHYRFTRNPQIIAYGVLIIGFALVWPSWYSLGWVLLYVAIAHMMVMTEEEHLLKVHGRAYQQYCARTPRYL